MAHSIVHVDTCLSCYLLDHHNRPGELLVGVELGTDSETAALAMRDEFNELGWDREDPAPTIETEECREALKGVDLSAGIADDDHDGETARAWFLLKWEA